MKSTGTIEAGTGLWHKPNKGATNSSCFTALPGGYRSADGLFIAIVEVGLWWSSAVYDGDHSVHCSLGYAYGDLFKNYNFSNHYGMSVRCIKD